MADSHVFPPDHIYLEPIILKTIQVFGYAPAAGKIHSIEESSSIHGDNSIRVAVSRDFTYVLSHIMTENSLYVGENGNGSNLDLLVPDRAIIAEQRQHFLELLPLRSKVWYTRTVRLQGSTHGI